MTQNNIITKYIIEEVKTKQLVETNFFSDYVLGIQDEDIGIDPELFDDNDRAKEVIDYLLDEDSDNKIFEIKTVYVKE